MKKAAFAALGIVSLALSVSTAGAAEKHRVFRHAASGDSREVVQYYPGWGRDPVLLYGVPAGLVYGGAASAPAR